METLQAHEAFEMAMLQWLRHEGLLQPLAFGGGTMLRLCHELPRYSFDMDFWFFTEVDFEGFYGRLEDAVRKDYDVTDLQNKFYSTLVEVRKAPKTPRLKDERGSPIKGLVKRKNTSPVEKISPFFHWPQCPHHDDIVFAYLLRARYFCLIGSGSDYADPHQSPIRIKASVPYATCLKHGP